MLVKFGNADEFVLCSSHGRSSRHDALACFHALATPWHCPSFTEGETEAQRVCETCPKATEAGLLNLNNFIEV